LIDKVQPYHAPIKENAAMPLYCGLNVHCVALVNPRIRASIIVSHYPIRGQYKGATRGNKHSIVKNHEGILTPSARFQRGKGATHAAPVDANLLILLSILEFSQPLRCWSGFDLLRRYGLVWSGQRWSGHGAKAPRCGAMGFGGYI